ncbi:MAG: hypothetical protein V4655_06110 [Bdellovibrionota bacterium]
MQPHTKRQFSPDELSERARRHAMKSRENLQVASRLLELFPQILRGLKKSVSGKGARADREALIHPEYQSKVDQYIEVLGEGLEARIQFETHRMMLQAMQSQNAFHRVLQQKRFSNNPLK